MKGDRAAKLQSEPPRKTYIKTLVDLITSWSSHAAFRLPVHGEPKYRKGMTTFIQKLSKILKLLHLQVWRNSTECTSFTRWPWAVKPRDGNGGFYQLRWINSTKIKMRDHVDTKSLKKFAFPCEKLQAKFDHYSIQSLKFSKLHAAAQGRHNHPKDQKMPSGNSCIAVLSIGVSKTCRRNLPPKI